MIVQLNCDRCAAIARRLKDIGLPQPVEPFGAAADSLAYDLSTLNLVIVSICHQTQSLMGEIEGRMSHGWDYLQQRFQEWAKEDGSRLSPQRLQLFTADDLRSAIKCGNQLGEKDLEQRASLIRDCGVQLSAKQLRSFRECYDRCDHFIAKILGDLSDFAAFQDPVRKKALYLLGLNGTTCGWQYKDPDLLDPPVDYHEIRGHLRLGTVRILDNDVRSNILKGVAVTQAIDIDIRTAVLDAIKSIAKLSGYAPMKLHYAFWNLFRKICLRRTPNCHGELTQRLPSEYQHLVNGNACCFVAVCDSVDLTIAIDEHKFDTDWY